MGLAKPQESFDPPVDNSNAPWVPAFPHLEGRVGAGGGPGWQHPYSLELAQLRYEPWQLEAQAPQPPGGPGC